MERIVRQLLDFSGHRPTEQRLVRVGKVVTRVCHSLEDFAETHGVKLSSQVERRDAAMPLDVTGLEQAIGNLVRNAIQAAPGGKVLVRTQIDGGAYRVSVEDNGGGVPHRIRGRIFEPFFTTKAVGQGTGLGLALAHRAIQDMGGTIDVMSSESGGARFEIVLPRERPSAQEAG
jgi:signal transduction histidine kinase